MDKAEINADCVLGRDEELGPGRFDVDTELDFCDLTGETRTGVLTRAATRLTGVRGVSPLRLATLLLLSLPASRLSSTSSSHSSAVCTDRLDTGDLSGDAAGTYAGTLRREVDEVDMSG